VLGISALPAEMPGTFLVGQIRRDDTSSGPKLPQPSHHSSSRERQVRTDDQERDIMTRRIVVCIALALILSWPVRASADLLLSFGQATYTIPGIGSSVQVPVFVSQTLSGPQVGIGNELLTAAITVSFNNPSGIAAVLSPLDITPGPAFDASSGGVTFTQATLAETSISGISDLSSPLLLGTFKFTGQSYGMTTIDAMTLTPGPSFVTSGGNFLDPTNVPTALVQVVPEPATYVLTCSAISTLGIVGWRRRKRTTRRCHHVRKRLEA
jgi:hypothetical protein